MRRDNISRFSRDIDKADIDRTNISRAGIDRANIGRADIDRALKEKKEREVHLDAIRGCLFGGAAGDALMLSGIRWSSFRRRTSFRSMVPRGSRLMKKTRQRGKR